MSAPFVGRAGPCAAGTCWISVNLPLCGSPVIPQLGQLTWRWDEVAGVWGWGTDGGAVPVTTNLGAMPAVENLFRAGPTGTHYGDVRDLQEYGDERAPARYLKVVVTIDTSAPFNADTGQKTPWGDDVPGADGTADRLWTFTWYFNPFDSRAQVISAQCSCFPGDGTFYLATLNADGTVTESDGAGGPPPSYGGHWTVVPALRPQDISNTILQWGGSGWAYINRVVDGDAGGNFNFWAEGTMVDSFHTRITITKTIMQSYSLDGPPPAPQPGDPGYAQGLVTRADLELAKYDLSNLSKAYTFYSEPYGEERTVTFAPHHSYYIYPFWKVDQTSGLTTKTMLWACGEPAYAVLPTIPDGDPSQVAPPISDGLYTNFGGYLATPVEACELAIEDPYNNPLWWVFLPAARDLVRVACVRRRPWSSFTTSAEQQFATTAGPGEHSPGTVPPAQFGMLDPYDPLLVGGTTALSNFTDYLEVGKAVVFDPTETCFVQYHAELGFDRASGWPIDDGEQPTITAAEICLGNWRAGSFLVDRRALGPPTLDPTWPRFGVGVVFRFAQVGWARLIPWDGTSPALAFALQGARWAWEACCTQEVGMAVDADSTPIDSDSRPIDQ